MKILKEGTTDLRGACPNCLAVIEVKRDEVIQHELDDDLFIIKCPCCGEFMNVYRPPFSIVENTVWEGYQPEFTHSDTSNPPDSEPYDPDEPGYRIFFDEHQSKQDE
jgi:hypothetical protein